MWWEGPAFLQSPADKWPKHEAVVSTEHVDKEIVKNPPIVSYVFVSVALEGISINLEKIIDPKRFSSIIRLLRVTALVICFIDHLKNPQLSRRHTSDLTASELSEAKAAWIKTIQSIQFCEEIKILQTKQETSNPLINQFGLFMDSSGIVRCRGRLGNSILNLRSKNHIILSPKHHFVELLIWDLHLRKNHSGTNEVLSILRERYWVLKGRQSVKHILRRCVVC